MKPKILFALLLLAVAFSCKKEEVQGIFIDRELLLSVGETATLTPTFVPANAHNKKVSWESSDTKVATVDNKGRVTGISAGAASITVISLDRKHFSKKCYVTVVQPIEPEMVWVEGGTFIMGCTDEQDEYSLPNEKPAHQVTLSSFYIGKYELPQKEWVATMGKNPSYYIGANMPVDCIKYIDIQKYINILNSYTGKKYRLPTEAEWEYAARGGNKSKGYKYSGSNDPNEVGWYSYIGSHTHPVGEKEPNELGIYDMSGNVFECCNDWYGDYSNNAQINPTGPATGTYHVLRGGGCNENYHIYARVSWRGGQHPHQASYPLGFRLVLPAE